MTSSTLPDFSANTAAAAPGSNAISLAELNSAGTPAAAPGDFADLMPDPKATPAVPPAVTATASAPSILSLCVPAAGELAAEEAGAVEAADETPTGPAPAVSRDTLEQSAAFAAGLLQTLLPEVTVPALGTGISATARRDAGPPAGSLNLEGTGPSVPEPAKKAAAAPAEGAAQEFQVTCAADGAVEIKLDLPAAKPAEAKATGENGEPAGTPVEIRAELELPGQAVMRFEASGSFTAGDQAQSGRAIFAAKMERAKARHDSTESAGERNFVFAGDKQVKPRSPEAGISVAKTDAIMSAAPIEEVQTVRRAESSSVLPVRPDFQVMPAPAERITAPVEASAGQTFAERAVATVTGLVDAQFSASMQKSGSVQLRLKFGGEDLSVRVELRGGAVHTDFRTDSAELRAALTRELQAVASQSPEQLRRYAAPVFSPAEASSSSSSSGDSHQPPGRQQAAQQDLPQRAPRPLFEEAAPFARRSLLRDSFFPEPAAARAPALLHTSLRLSALA